MPPAAGAPPRLEELRFADAHTGAQHAALRAHILTRAQGWRHVPLDRAGNLLSERWCSPEVPERACAQGTAGRDPAPGMAWATLGTLTYPKRFPEVFGLTTSSGTIPAVEGWGVSLGLRLRGATISGSGLDIRFLRVDGGQLGAHLDLGTRLSLRVADADLWVDAPEPADAPSPEEAAARAAEAELARLQASPESLRDTAFARLDALQARVDRALDAGEPLRLKEGPYKGGGVPPERLLLPLDAEGAKAARDQAHAELEARRALVREHAPALHAALVAVLPALP